ncbi:MAG: hypothetical protein QW599_06100 [Nitrososphaerota archaeon]
MRRAFKLTFLIIPLFSMFAVQSVGAQYLNISRFRLPSYELYAPAQIIVSFVYTNNVSVNVRTLGTSLYKVTTSPVQIIFEADAFDVYFIDAVIAYSIPVNQTIIIGLYEGGRATKGIEFDTNADRIEINIKVSVVEAPRYPTAEEIANSMWSWLQAQLSEFMGRQENLVEGIGKTSLTVGVLGAISFAVCCVLILAVFYIYRRVAELNEWRLHQVEGS